MKMSGLRGGWNFPLASLYEYYNREAKTKPESPSELYRPSDQRLSAKLVPTFADRGCHVISVMHTRLSGPRSRPTTTKKIW
jgi:hypothetical protein